MLKITIAHHALAQAEILVHGKRFGYLALGADRKINWLPKEHLKIETGLTTSERLAISRAAREVVDSLTAERDSQLAELGEPLTPKAAANCGYTWQPVELEVETGTKPDEDQAGDGEADLA